MYLDRDQLMLLSRAGHMPRSGPVSHPEHVSVARARPGPGRLRALVQRRSLRLRSRPGTRPALDTHQYLRLEFAVDDEPRPTRRR